VYRVLRLGGLLLISVPDMEVLAALILDNRGRFSTRDRRVFMSMVYGGQDTEYNFHKAGFTLDILTQDLEHAGFCNATRVGDNFNIFEDMSSLAIAGYNISLSVAAIAC
jgi:predicted SAM-dependent methyltransferase